MKVRFVGAVRTVTGSMHHLSHGGKELVLDAGFFQGRRKEAFERNRKTPVEPAKLDAIVVSHAHIDHSANLPSLVKQGFDGPIYCTPATADLMEIMLHDCAHILAKDVEYINKRRKKQGKKLFEPLYDDREVDMTVRLFRPVPYGQQFELWSGLSAVFYDAGHMLGSASIRLNIQQGTHDFSLGFTGDLGRKGLPIIRDPRVMPAVDWLITESTYGNRLHPPPEDMLELLAKAVEETFERNGVVLIPAFSVGRTQHIVYTFQQLIHAHRLPEIPIFVDSPLSVTTTEVFSRHSECFDKEALKALDNHEDPFGFHRVSYITDVEESKALNNRKAPCVIISASGMCEAGRILHHLKHRVADPHNLIIIPGFQADHTLGKRLVLRVPFVKILGEEYPLKARVVVLNGFSAHADRNELLEYVQSCASTYRGIFIVHGADDQALAFQAHLESRRYENVVVPHFDETFEINGARRSLS